jgi:hypothetical protein
MVPSFTEKDQLIAAKETSIKEEDLPITIETKLSIANDIYALTLKRKTLNEQWNTLFEKIKPTSTLSQRMIGNIVISETAGDITFAIIGNTLIAGAISGSALAINYINKYITPEKYQTTVSDLSTGIAKFVSGLAAINVTQQGMQSLYNFFMYGSKEQIKNTLEKLSEEINKIQQSIKDIKEKYHFFDEYISYNEQKTCEEFMNFYNNNHGNINIQNINTFLLTHQDYSIEKLLRLFQQKKIDVIIKLSNINLTRIVPTKNNTVLTKILFEPWYTSLGLFERKANKELKSFSERITTWLSDVQSENITEYNKYTKEMNAIDQIIQKLSNLASQTTSP